MPACSARTAAGVVQTPAPAGIVGAEQVDDTLGRRWGHTQGGIHHHLEQAIQVMHAGHLARNLQEPVAPVGGLGAGEAAGSRRIDIHRPGDGRRLLDLWCRILSSVRI
jgi:hypothetical protein